ncbi:MAG: hypothetical protein LBN25_02635, partial [Christensenellaceae bacterium]|nr:hypothetical protein [Christensenellaceae bacterium]
LKRINRSFTSGSPLTDGGAVITPLLVTVRRDYSAKLSTIVAKVTAPGEFDESYRSSVRTLIESVTPTPVYDPYLAFSNTAINGGGAYDTNLLENSLFQNVTLPELLNILGKDETALVLWGGIRDAHTTAILPAVQKAAEDAEYNGKIFVFDPVLTAINGAPSIASDDTLANIGTNGKSASYSVLYSTLLDGLFTGYGGNRQGEVINGLGGIGGSGVTLHIQTKHYGEIGTPSLIVYNKAIEGGIIDCFESAFTYAFEPGNPLSGTELFDGDCEKSKACVYLKKAAADIFLKAELTNAFLQAEYTVTAELNVERTVITAERENAKIVLYNYANPSAANAQKREFATNGVAANDVSEVTYYYYAAQETERIIAAVNDKTIYTEGVLIGAPGYDKSALGGGAASSSSSDSDSGTGSGGGAPIEEEEIC